MMKKINYVFDLDGTVFSIKPFVKLMNAYTGKNLKIRDIKLYNFFDAYGLDKHDPSVVKYFDSILAQVFTHQRINDALVADIKRWHRQGIGIIFLTARAEVYRGLTLKRLADFNIPYDAIYFGKQDKRDKLVELGGVRFFDDRGETIKELLEDDVIKGMYELTLIDAPYNKDLVCNSRYFWSYKK